jgi:predicted RNA-binding protein associated with RNAse of E/G family
MAACIEKKLTLSGKTYLFPCELVQITPRRGVLRYVIDREYTVAGIRLFPGYQTDALYWTDRPYTLYLWHTRSHGRVYYFNIADSVAISPEMFVWRDLVVDILVTGQSSPQILDEDELPSDLAPGLGAYIRSATDLILQTYRTIIEETDGIISSLSPA